ncbi:hypothetical protein FA95DRAFT_812126 [Auriscalpium vulgare]|uniref:Uncharacterized protein n=1 Tax=Auriscalpium vulgare TaxID=40419 RepID=A0ACB8RBA3_9AGAM|nr:hypothetical protein FA95DRAFT_812126 [Auriscalpium vulgare]
MHRTVWVLGTTLFARSLFDKLFYGAYHTSGAHTQPQWTDSSAPQTLPRSIGLSLHAIGRKAISTTVVGNLSDQVYRGCWAFQRGASVRPSCHPVRLACRNHQSRAVHCAASASGLAECSEGFSPSDLPSLNAASKAST